MDLLAEMITQMDKHAVRQFKIFAARTREEMERKDLQLFDYIRTKGPEFDEERIFKKLYEGEDKNAFYRLKNRLLKDISQSVFLHQHDNNDSMLCLYNVAMGYHYAGINNHKLAFYFFKKAEQKAKDIENYGILDIIYSQMIKLAREIVSINPETYIQKRKENRNLLNKLSEVEDILEALEYRIKVSLNLSQASTALPEILQNTLNEYTKDEELRQSAKVQFGIYFIISRILLQNKDSVALENYLIETLENFTRKKFFNKANHQHKLQLLTWIANASFMNKKYALSLEYAEKLKKEMESFERSHYDQFEFFYYNALVINFSEINPAKAIEVLLELSKNDAIAKHIYYGIYVYLNLAVMYFTQRQYSKCIVSLNRLYQHEGYENTDRYVKMSVYIGELMVRFETRELDVVDYRLKQIMKDNRELLADKAMEKEKQFLDIFSRLAEDSSLTRKSEFKSEIAEYLSTHKEAWVKEDYPFKYHHWLAEKIN
jgi:hypothetical protein